MIFTNSSLWRVTVMIREFQRDDINKVADIWLDTNIKAHNFIPAEYWKSNFKSVKEALLLAEVYVYEYDTEIQGFIGLNDEYVEGIFVSGEMQSQGIGKILLNYAKDKRNKLLLNVYQKNARAISFYKREEFEIQHSGLDEATGEKDYVMTWQHKQKFKFDGVMDMKIREVNENKKQFISLLLLADEQESMVDRYLEKGNMYVLEDGNVKAECVVTDEGNEILEIKNIAVNPENQGKGYGKALIDFLASKYADEYSVLQVGTGDSPLTVPFYEKCGFVRSHNIPNFFTDNYDHPIYECGVQLIDMVYLQRCL